eukprot:CAMPEP_0113940706 /NCGR_PEP_ID=MMETSP1339-20121228/6783_1 /TAXON_ID=94617 /ORGANISM="Fibrocapsa japonica" /LENGTH=78 /DNA_ID=CAMNT_0000944631 /DNA_START=427 /DNA_END=659 /DNA_ORIENTATION=- /assembly_acc=CAM_ASM_000762
MVLPSVNLLLPALPLGPPLGLPGAERLWEGSCRGQLSWPWTSSSPGFSGPPPPIALQHPSPDHLLAGVLRFRWEGRTP